jgi:glycine cleavage system regulatory protein
MQIFKSSSSSSSSMEALRIIKKSKKSKKDDKPAVFGVRLDPNSNQVPRILQFVVEFFDQEGVNIEGLFRISGAMSQMLALKAAFDNGMCTRASSCVCVCGLVHRLQE